MNEPYSPLQDVYTRVTTEHGVHDFISRYFSYFDGPPIDDSEEGFMKRMSTPIPPADDIRESSVKRIRGIVPELFRAFEMIAASEKSLKNPRAVATTLRAFHFYLFSLLYRAGTECRALLESAPGFIDFDGPEDYARHIQKKYRLGKADFSLLALEWTASDEDINQNLLCGNWTLMIFGPDDTDGACFLLRDKKRDSVLKCEAILCTDRDLVISKYFFFLRILFVLRYCELLARITALEKGAAHNDEDTNSIEIFEMEAFRLVAESFFEKLANHRA